LHRIQAIADFPWYNSYDMARTEQKLEVATFGGGCFWCTEAIFKRLRGVTKVISGYAGGKRNNPTYDQVSTGATGHAEAIQVTFDSAVISYETLLDVFFATHNPTTLNQQGADIGTQYRSVIFYHSPTQQQIAKTKKELLNQTGVFDKEIVTELIPYDNFYTAEEYHQNYYDANPQYPYCRIVINPKLDKLLKEFGELVKPEYK
jgi:peptide-methionine (S)-S-oxide reductase